MFWGFPENGSPYLAKHKVDFNFENYVSKNSVASTAKLQLQLPALDGHEGRAYEILVEGLGLKILELEVIVGGVAFRLHSLRFRL